MRLVIRPGWSRVATIAIELVCLGLAADVSSGQSVRPSPMVPRTQGGGKGGISPVLDEASRRVRIQGKEAIALGKDNVLFVDEVDSPSGPRVVGSMSVASAMPGSAGQIAPILRSSPRVMAFLRCDAGDDSPRRERLRMMCLENIGVER